MANEKDETTASILSILKDAEKQIDDVTAKADQTIQVLEQNMQQVKSQKLGISYQKALVVELQSKIKSVVAKQTQEGK